MKTIRKKKTKLRKKRKSKSGRSVGAPIAVGLKAKVHYTEQYLINPPHPVTINVVGCGGTGSQVLNSLGRFNSALKALGHPGLYVRAIDPDKITEANMGRQLFSQSDVGDYKCTVLISRLNRFFGLDWEAQPELYNIKSGLPEANITISCVDSAAARRSIREVLLANAGNNNYREPFHKQYYWMDFGNMRDRGQVVIGTLRDIKQPDSEFDTVAKLPWITKLHPDIIIDAIGDEQGPSCSLAEALGRQDLFINTNLANMGLAILWKMFRELRIKYHGCYLNLENMSVNPIKIK